jgi:hypothetical protein
MRSRGVILPTLVVVAILGSAARAGTLPASSAPDDTAAPAWNKQSRLTDGRIFVTDGAIALDAALAKPATLEGLTSIPPAAIERLLNSAVTTEVKSSALSARDRGYVTPGGVLLARRYVEFLRRHAGAAALRFKVAGPRDPVLIVVHGQTVGVVMPLAQ